MGLEAGFEKRGKADPTLSGMHQTLGVALPYIDEVLPREGRIRCFHPPWTCGCAPKRWPSTPVCCTWA